MCCCNFFKSRQSFAWVGLGWWSLVSNSYCYLGKNFSSDGSRDKHIKSLIVCNMQKLAGLYWVLHNFALDLRICRHILMAGVRPSLEYGCEVWKTNKCQAKLLKVVQLCACKCQAKSLRVVQLCACKYTLGVFYNNLWWSCTCRFRSVKPWEIGEIFVN